MKHFILLILFGFFIAINADVKVEEKQTLNEYKIEQFKSALQYIRFLRTETKLDEALSFLQKEEQILKEIPDSDSLAYSFAMNKFLIYEEKHHIVSAYRELILAGEIADRLQNKEKQQGVEEKS